MSEPLMRTGCGPGAPDLFFESGSAAHGRYTVDIDQRRAGWDWSSLRVLNLPAGGVETLDTGDEEILVLPLQGGCTVTVGGEHVELAGRASVFTAVSDCAYVGRGTTVTVSSTSGGRFALPGAISQTDLPLAYYAAEQVRVEVRGAGACSRQVNNYALGTQVTTSHLLVCEVLTPGGNWSSYPAHKHERFADDERELEEIYYFEVAPGPTGVPGFALHRTYGTPQRPIDLFAEVRSGDVALVPYGWHGPCVAAPGHDLYYLNVMAGPALDRTWLAVDDPNQQWVRDAWQHQPVDARLPMTSWDKS